MKAEIKAFTKGVPFEEEAVIQVDNLANSGLVSGHIAIMPDVHFGMGATIGSVFKTVNVVIPAAVGVDIGCGMVAVKTSLKSSNLPDNLFDLRCRIEAAVPHGRTNNGRRGDRGSWSDIPSNVASVWHKELSSGYHKIADKYPMVAKSNSYNHLGTLGGGNHFVEICIEPEDESVWIMLHSGSRGVGNSIGRTFIEEAKKSLGDKLKDLADPNLAYLKDDLMDDYITSMSWAQKYASMNRMLMLENVIKVMKSFWKDMRIVEKAINCHHNYIEFLGDGEMLTRKGAVSAKKGQLGIIPGSMGAKSYIVEGLGNEESHCSCSHGAGRVMSRTKAKKIFTVEDQAEQTKGVECRKDKDVIDEIPAAYKDIDSVMEAQKDLVKIKHTIKQVLCVKG